MDGRINLAAPSPLPNREFMEALRDAWEVPNGFPPPRPMLGCNLPLAPSRSWCCKAAA